MTSLPSVFANSPCSPNHHYDYSKSLSNLLVIINNRPHKRHDPAFRTHFNLVRPNVIIPLLNIPEVPSIIFGLFYVRSLSNKAFVLNKFILSQKLDFFFITETWLKEGECCQLLEPCLLNFKYFNSPRECGHGGGLAVVFKNLFKCSPLTVKRFTSFEALVFLISCTDPLCCIVIYCTAHQILTLFYLNPLILLRLWLSSMITWQRLVISFHIDDATNAPRKWFYQCTWVS